MAMDEFTEINLNDMTPEEIAEAERKNAERYPEACPCATGPENRLFTLTIEEGGISIQCMSCNKPWGEDWDAIECVGTAPIVCSMEVNACSNPGGWHGMERCDCDVYFSLIPVMNHQGRDPDGPFPEPGHVRWQKIHARGPVSPDVVSYIKEERGGLTTLHSLMGTLEYDEVSRGTVIAYLETLLRAVRD